MEAAKNLNIVMEENSYNRLFSKIYDRALDNVDYEKIGDFILELLRREKIKAKKFLDLGCGTGTMTRIFAKKGYDVTGLDISTDMLIVASEKSIDENLSIFYINQSMSELELIDNYDLIYSTNDSLNYLLTEAEILSTFKSVYKYLSNNGLFVFDLNTIYRFKSYGNKVFKESTDDFLYVWENEFDEKTNINTYNVDMFVKDGETYSRSVEEHMERGYEHALIKKMLSECGFKEIKMYGNIDFDTNLEKKDKIYFVAKKVCYG